MAYCSNIRKPKFSVRNKDVEAGGHRATVFSKAGGPTENPVAKIDFFINHKD